MELSELISGNFSSEDEKQKLNIINKNNTEILEKFKKTMELLDKIEISMDQKVKRQLSDIKNMKKNMLETTEIFRTICQNNIKQ